MARFRMFNKPVKPERTTITRHKDIYDGIYLEDLLYGIDLFDESLEGKIIDIGYSENWVLEYSRNQTDEEFNEKILQYENKLQKYNEWYEKNKKEIEEHLKKQKEKEQEIINKRNKREKERKAREAAKEIILYEKLKKKYGAIDG